MNNFLSSILGEVGAKALERASESAPLLRPVIVPRAIIAWLQTMGALNYEGNIPGVDNSYLSLQKNQTEDYTGAITIDNFLLTFEKSDLLNVAASLGVALKIDVGELDERLKRKDLTNLGKSIDLLVKSEVIKQLKKAKAMDGSVPHQVPLKPQTQGAPQAPSKQDPKQQLQGTVTAGQGIAPKAALRHKGVELKVDKSESEKSCEDCGKKFFKDDKFDGCKCLKELSKNVSTETIDGGYLLKFRGLDSDAITTICDLLKD
jgi:hypothetical protein